MKTVAFSKERGIALVVTLAILIIATILVVGFVSSMRTERAAAVSNGNNAAATTVAQSAVDHAIAILDKNIPQPVPPGTSTSNPTNWIVNPGLLTTVQGTNAPVQIPLSSNPSATYTSTNQDAQLNVSLLSGSGYTILPTSDSMRVAWVSLLKDPSTTASSTNQIAARYAFWIDDESSKVNVNTAIGKPANLDFSQLTPGIISINSATYPLGHPSSINLDVFGSISASNLATAVSQQNGLASIESMKPFVQSGSPDSFINSNKFDLTAYSRAPDFNVFGKSKLYFLRSATGQLGRPMFQFFRDADGPEYFPSEENAKGADRHSTYYTAAAISAYLNRNDWPGMPARSFVDKWGGNDAAKREADQVAWNLMSMGSFAAGSFSGNSASSNYFELANATKSGETGFVSVNKPNNDTVIGTLSGKAMLPAYPVPLINEVALQISPQSYTIADGTTKYRLLVSLTTELWLPPGYPTFDFGQAQTTVGLTYLWYHVTQAQPGTADAQQEDAKYVDRLSAPDDNGIKKLWTINNVGTAAPNSYSQFVTTQTFYVSNKSGFNSGANGSEDFTTTGTISLDFKMRLFALTQQKNGSSYGTKHSCQLIPVWDTHDPGITAAPTNWDPTPPSNPPRCLAPPADDPKDYIEFQFTLTPPFNSGDTYTRSLEVADPHLGGLAKSWQQAPNFNSPATLSAGTLGSINSATTSAGYDTKKLAFVDLSQTALASKHSSTGFLSLVATGMQRGVAGAALKFQPSSSASELPDWLLLDLVAPAVTAVDYSSLSWMNSTAGVINANSKILPNVGSFSAPVRWRPMQALLENMPGVSGAANASAIVTNLINHTTSGVDFGATSEYDYPGEVCEISGVADSGNTDWDKETIIRNLAGCLTTKSNVFSVWGVTQTVKKNPGNNDPATGQPRHPGIFESKAAGAAADDLIMGEKRFEAVVERYVWPGNDNIAGDGHVPGAGGSYDRLSSSATQPGYPPPYSGGAWEQLDGPDAPTYPISSSTDAWIASAPNYSNTPIDSANNPVGATMKYRVIYFRYLND